MAIALIANSNICYNSLNFFSESIERILNKYGYETKVVDVINDEFLTYDWDAIIGINQDIFSKQFEDGSFVFDYLSCPLLSIIVDPPYFHDKQLRHHPERLQLICLDAGHVKYASKYYSPLKKIEMGFLVGDVAANKIPYENRSIDLFFSGSNVDLGQIEQKIYAYNVPWIRDLFEYLVERGKANPSSKTNENVLFYLYDNNISFSAEDYKTAMSICGTYSELFLRGYYREKVIREIADAGIKLVLAGGGWERLAEQYPNSIQNIGVISFEEVAKNMSNSKIVLNVMPWFKDGMHDRILSAMHNGAVCVTDKSSYIESHFSDGEDILLYDLGDIGGAPNKIKTIMNNLGTAKKIASLGYEKIKEEYTWDVFVQNYILPSIK